MCPNTEFFCSTFSHIRTEYGETRSISHLDTIYAVSDLLTQFDYWPLTFRWISKTLVTQAAFTLSQFLAFKSFYFVLVWVNSFNHSLTLKWLGILRNWIPFHPIYCWNSYRYFKNQSFIEKIKYVNSYVEVWKTFSGKLEFVAVQWKLILFSIFLQFTGWFQFNCLCKTWFY